LRIAVLNAWPNLEYSAEREFIARLKIACAKLGWTCIETITSDEIIAADVDCLLTTHEYSPKLTHIPTIGLLWSPPGYFSDDPGRVRNILSYDGYIAGSDSVREYLGDLLYSTKKNSPVSDFNFLPTAPGTEFRPPNLNDPSLFYAGVHWDGRRHAKLIKKLHTRLPVSFYGDPKKWALYGKAYKGRIPFDGTSIFAKINSAGVALCLHKDEHLRAAVPSMRIFESAAASAVIITENSSFTLRHFGDSVLYVDKDASESDKADQIIRHFEWVRANPDDALALAARSHDVFNQHFSLETLLGKLPEFLAQVNDAGCFSESIHPNSQSKVDAIVRVGGRDLKFIERCLDSLAAQSHRNLGLILVSYATVAGIDDLLQRYDARFTTIQRIFSEATGFRSTALWDGMRAVEGDYFCNLDDDDTIHPNHVSSLVSLLNNCKDFNVAYSGCIQVQDEQGHYYEQVNFKGPVGLPIKENRKLCFFDPFNMQRMLHLENFVVSNAWLARKAVLEHGILVDPRLIVAEDVYLYQLFLHHGNFLFSWRATANWHWRSSTKDNSTIYETCKEECRKRIILRTQFFDLSQNALTCLDVARPFVTYTWEHFPRVKRLFRYLKMRLFSDS
jgi:glycosyltransferase involved in cell wall biosynthesis